MSDFERGFGTLVGIIIGVLVIYLVLALVEYILRGIALYRMASNARFSTPILAWIPVASSYLLGSLCDRSVYCRSGKQWRLSVILPVIDLLGLFGGGSLAVLSGLVGYLNYDWYGGGFDSEYLPSVSSLVGLAAMVITLIGLYHLYWDYSQGQEVLFTVLSVIFGGLGQAIILFILRDRVPVSAQGGGWQQPYPGGYPQGPYAPGPGQPPPYQGGPYTTGPQQPYQGGPYTTGPQQPYQGGPYTTGPQQPYQGGPYTTGPQQPYQGGPYTTGPQQPYQTGPNTTQWSQPPAQGGYPPTTDWNQAPSPGEHQIPQDPPRSGKGPEDIT